MTVGPVVSISASHTAGRASAKFALQAACATLLQSAGSQSIPAGLRDAYWTLVAYFNLLCANLGGAHVLMLDDVSKIHPGICRTPR